MFNIISSNIINLLQYIISIFTSKNQKILKNRAIKIDLIMVAFTIIVPIFILKLKIDSDVNFIPIYILLFFLFYYINNNTHKLYLKSEESEIEKEIEEESKNIKGKIGITIKYLFLLVIASCSLYIVGNALSIVLENLAQIFDVPEIILGIALGIITSIPELITFYESQKHHNKKNNAEMGVVEATNNLLTSNILNIFIIQSLGILIYTLFIKI